MMFFGWKIVKVVRIFKLNKLFCFMLPWDVNVVRMGITLLKVKDPIDFWYSISDRRRIYVGCGRCKWVDLTIVHGFSEPDNYIVVVVEFIFQWF